MRALVTVVVCRGNIGRLGEGFRGRRQPLDCARYEAGADVTQHRLGLLRSGRPILEGACVVAVLPRVTAVRFAKGNTASDVGLCGASSLYSGRRRDM